MPRAERVLVPGGVGHVYNRVVRGGHLFRDEDEAGRSSASLGETKQWDDFVVMAYCVMGGIGARWEQSIEPIDQPVARHHDLIHWRMREFRQSPDLAPFLNPKNSLDS